MKHRSPKENYIQRILDNLSSAVLFFDHDLILRYINTAGEILLAVSARQIIGMRVSEINQCPAELLEFHLDRAKDLGHVFTEREYLMRTADDKEIIVDCTVTPIREENSKVEYLIEIQQVDHQVRVLREKSLLSRNEVSRALIKNLAHEIKNPLGGLRGAAQLLERELADEELREYTQIIIQEADRLHGLVDHMLGPNKLPKSQELSIHQVLERVCQLVQVEVGDRLRIKRDYDPSIPNMVGDLDQLIQAFLNIMRNGARAAGAEGSLIIKSRILRQFMIGNLLHRHVISVEIEDNGPGIQEELQDKIFFPMVSGQENGEGMGLGLSIAQSLISRHGGLIEFNSRPGKTVFCVLLPLEQVNG